MKSFSIDESPYAFARVYMVKICLSQTRIGQGKDCVSFVDRVMCFCLERLGSRTLKKAVVIQCSGSRSAPRAQRLLPL